MELAVESLETPALTKAQLAELLFEQIGLNKRESKDMIDAFFDLISDSLVDGKDVKISGFGNFQIRTKAPRPGRNPRTGEAIPNPGSSRRDLSREPQTQRADPGRLACGLTLFVDTARPFARAVRQFLRLPDFSLCAANKVRVTSKLSLVPH